MVKIKIMILVVVCAIFVAVTACHQPKQSETISSAVTTPNALAMEEVEFERISQMYERLMTSFSPDWIEREADPMLYPPYYAGVYVRDVDGRFVVLVTDDAEKHKQALVEKLGTDEFDVEVVRYSYREMNEVINHIEHFIGDATVSDNHPFIQNFNGAYIDDMSNRVIVMLINADDEVVDAFRKNVSNSTSVVMIEGSLLN